MQIFHFSLKCLCIYRFMLAGGFLSTQMTLRRYGAHVFHVESSFCDFFFFFFALLWRTRVTLSFLASALAFFSKAHRFSCGELHLPEDKTKIVFTTI